MIKQSLNGKWLMKKVGDDEQISALVPSSVYNDLLTNGKMDDPFKNDNFDRALELMNFDYEYEKKFVADASLFSKDKILLRFDGLDTICDIYLNGVKIGNTYNMHRTWEFDVTKKLINGENILKVVLHSPLKYIDKEFKKCRTIGDANGMDGFVHIRKAHCMFGWDWGAHLPDAGIFRDVTIIGIDKARIQSVYITQKHSKDKVTLNVEVEKQFIKRGKTETKIEITSPKGETTTYLNQKKIVIENPLLWWPNGLGEQNLYKVKTYLIVDGEVVDENEKRIGLRTLTMKRQKDKWGESFAHEINGKTIFACGADYIPEDHLITRVNEETTRKLLETCKLSNFNTIRVWGGGYYPSDWFFDICDELGLIVWQDFMFACAVYELTPEFEANIRQEFIDNIKRIRNHASLGLWCGNNEMELFLYEKHEMFTKPSEVKDYFLMYERIIPEVVKEYDSQTFYWPASPSSGGSLDNPNDENRGDVHYWAVWHGNKPFSEYRKFYFRYASEFGFQSFSSKKTLETVIENKEDMNPFSYIMEKHQRQTGANSRIASYLGQTYLYPNSFDKFIYASQLLQADAIKYGVEHFRRNRGRCMGAIYWQLNDCWPVISWASVDYTGRWKALQYYAKRFFNPIMISCEEQGMLTTEKDMNRQHYSFEKSFRLNVANETLNDEEFIVKWQLRNNKAEILEEEEKKVFVKSLSAVWLDKVDMQDIDEFSEYVSYELIKGNEVVSSGTVIFSLPKYFKYIEPKFELKVNGDEIEISSNVYAKSVEILNENEDIVLSDNYFDLNGDTRKVKILRGKSDNLKVRSVYDIR